MRVGAVSVGVLLCRVSRCRARLCCVESARVVRRGAGGEARPAGEAGCGFACLVLDRAQSDSQVCIRVGA
eukprot:1533875-Pleurochrysis_carterae.AAC.1